MDLHISHITDQDCGDVAEFLVSALPEGWRTTDLPERAQVQRVVSSEASIALMARRKGAVVGVAVGWCFPNVIGQGDVAMLDELLVASDYRRQGIGTALVKAFKTAVRRKCTPPIAVWATTDYPQEPAASPFIQTGGEQGELLRQFNWPEEVVQ